MVCIALLSKIGSMDSEEFEGAAKKVLGCLRVAFKRGSDISENSLERLYHESVTRLRNGQSGTGTSPWHLAAQTGDVELIR